MVCMIVCKGKLLENSIKNSIRICRFKYEFFDEMHEQLDIDELHTNIMTQQSDRSFGRRDSRRGMNKNKSQSLNVYFGNLSLMEFNM